MKKWLISGIIIVLALASVSFFDRITGLSIENFPGESHTIGPTQAETDCMMACASTGCNPGDIVCMRANGEECQKQCNTYQPEPASSEEDCMQKCVVAGCGDIDFDCQGKNQAKCEEECGMIKEPEPKNEEERCIRECVKKADPNLICKPGEGGERGNEICQRCAQECVSLYAGPCLGDEALRAKEQECQTCEHCYGEPVMGDSGEGYDCIVDMVCKDASAEFGDEPGTGESQGIIGRTGDTISAVARNIVGFFKNLFGIGNEEQQPKGQPEEPANEQVEQPPSQPEAQ